MRLTEEERERLANAGYIAMLSTLRQSRNKPHALLKPWETVDTESQNGFRACVDAVADGLLPPGTVAIDAAALWELIDTYGIQCGDVVGATAQAGYREIDQAEQDAWKIANAIRELIGLDALPEPPYAGADEVEEDDDAAE